jgi:hypothetical protein
MKRLLLAGLILLPSLVLAQNYTVYSPSGTPGNTGQIPMFQATGTPGSVVPSSLTDNGTTLVMTRPVGSYLANMQATNTTACTLGTSNSGCSAQTSGDCGTFILFSAASAVTVTVPNTLPAGCQVALAQNGAGVITVSAGAGTTARSPHAYTHTNGQYAIVGVNVVTNSGGTTAVYYFSGDGA